MDEPSITGGKASIAASLHFSDLNAMTFRSA